MRLCHYSLLLLAACATEDSPADNPKKDVDPALAMALEDQILIDPTLSQQANEDAIRPPDRPVQILVPDVLGADLDRGPELARLLAAERARFPGCPAATASFGWAARLSEELALPAKGVVREAFGGDGPGCALRAVHYWVPQPPGQALARYAALPGFKAMKTGDHLTARGANGATLLATARASGEGAAVMMITNRGN